MAALDHAESWQTIYLGVLGSEVKMGCNVLGL